ncbi:unnamed protein product [Lactuca saligna]|uniref:Uncharacterized protein n=1 Tax=Lactuca saligna TaxID=75948 RepID=A0AA35YM84_LACSI|nr:unnamed protein product [Lactuca saligna]
MKKLGRLQFQLCLSDYIIPALVEALHKEPETEICSTMIDSLKECVKICGSLLHENQARSIVKKIKQVITASSARRNERGERVNTEDFDVEDGEMLKQENEMNYLCYLCDRSYEYSTLSNDEEQDEEEEEEEDID